MTAFSGDHVLSDASLFFPGGRIVVYRVFRERSCLVPRDGRGCLVREFCPFGHLR
jgi:hypothetical protein